MSILADLTPGTVGFGPIHGAAGMLVNAGQLLLGEGFRVGQLDIRHVFVVVEAGRPNPPYPDGLGNFKPRIVEAMPHGAREVAIGPERWTPEYAYVQLPEDYPGQAEDAAAIARAMIGIPYSFASYAALAAWHWGVKTPKLETWINRRHMVASGALAHKDISILNLPREAICSVLADQAWALTGKQVMPEGTPHQCVTPGALAQALLEMEGAKWLWPGMTGR